MHYLCKVSDFGLARTTGLEFVGSKVDNPGIISYYSTKFYTNEYIFVNNIPNN